MDQGLFKNVHFIIFWTFFMQTFFYNFCKFSDAKNRALELSNDASFVIFGHQTWDLEGGGGQSTPAGIGLTEIPKSKF